MVSLAHIEAVLKKAPEASAEEMRNEAYDEVMRYVAVTSFGAQSSMRAVYETAVW